MNKAMVRVFSRIKSFRVQPISTSFLLMIELAIALMASGCFRSHTIDKESAEREFFRRPFTWNDLPEYKTAIARHIDLTQISNGNVDYGRREIERFILAYKSQERLRIDMRTGPALAAEAICRLPYAVVSDGCLQAERDWFCDLVGAVFACRVANPAGEAEFTMLYFLVSDFFPDAYFGNKLPGEPREMLKKWPESEMCRYLRGTHPATSEVLRNRISAASKTNTHQGLTKPPAQ